jgi:exonuclease SbcC
MIPVKLTIKNFMCYRDNVPPLSFEGMHVACLGGDNGNGKSAIFDAMTWALWGESRAKSDDDLIYLGQSEMDVEFEFTARDQCYRVIRKRTRKPSLTRAGQTILELQVSHDDGFKSISGNSIQDTQQKIIELLRLDYKTFVNSAFLRQGHSDEFSIKRPSERKEILANILNLHQYDELERLAKDYANQRKSDSGQTTRSIEEIDSQLASEGDYEASIDETQGKLKQIEQQKGDVESNITSLRLQNETLTIKKEQYATITSHLKDSKDELEQLKAMSEGYKTKIADYIKMLSDKEKIEKAYAEFLEVRKRNDILERQFRQFVDLREQIRELEEAIRQKNQLLTIEYEKIEGQIREKEDRVNQLPRVEEELINYRKSLNSLNHAEEILNEKRKQELQISSRKSELISTIARLEHETANDEEKLTLLQTGDDVRCPLCETELGTEGRQRIQTKLNLEIDENKKMKHSLHAEADKSELELQNLQNEIAEAETTLNRERAELQKQVALKEKELTEIRNVAEDVGQDKEKLKELEQHLTSKDYCSNEQQKLAQLQQETDNLGYDSELHTEIGKQLGDLQEYETRKLDLDETERALQNEKLALNETEKRISALDSVVVKDVKGLEDLKSGIDALSDTPDKLTNAEKDYKNVLSIERELRDTLATYQERMRNLKELEQKKKEKEEALSKFIEEESIYKELADAFSKRGVQALLISQAFPEIEIEANRLLGKMTDNRLSLTLESQREMKSKKGEAIETLDIKIADEIGTRNYEMFSGGEAFRIDLALRIALSKLLVRRAGASLPILIIDEGFGTQDSSGKERMVEAINSIQDDFEKIFVITHLEELKERFPVLINVYKTPEGSMISVA